MMERATKLIVTLWTCAALAALVFFIRQGWSALPLLAAALFVITCIATELRREAVGLVLVVSGVMLGLGRVTGVASNRGPARGGAPVRPRPVG